MRGEWFPKQLDFLNKDPGVPVGDVVPVPHVPRGQGTGLNDRCRHRQGPAWASQCQGWAAASQRKAETFRRKMKRQKEKPLEHTVKPACVVSVSRPLRDNVLA